MDKKVILIPSNVVEDMLKQLYSEIDDDTVGSIVNDAIRELNEIMETRVIEYIKEHKVFTVEGRMVVDLKVDVEVEIAPGTEDEIAMESDIDEALHEKMKGWWSNLQGQGEEFYDVEIENVEYETVDFKERRW